MIKSHGSPRRNSSSAETPLGDYRWLLQQALALSDLITLAAALLAAYWVTSHLLGRQFTSIADYAWLYWVIAPAWLYSLRNFGFYRAGLYNRLPALIFGLIKVQVISGLLLFSAMYLTKSAQISRLLLQCFVVLSLPALLAQKLAVREVLARMRSARSLSARRVLLVGNSTAIEHSVELVTKHAYWRAEVVGILTAEPHPHRVDAFAVLGTARALPRVAAAHIIDEVVVVSALPRSDLERLAEWCAQRGLIFRLLVELPPTEVGRYSAHELNPGCYFVSLETIPQHALNLLIKRTIDIAVALVGLMVCALAYLWYRGRIRRETGGSVLFKQQRVGQNGRVFTIYKFRTMYVDAEQRLSELRVANQMSGQIFKIRDDPRITPLGNFLRRRHIDELPQFWNVLRGDMSVVGTRPPTRDEVAQYHEHHYRRLSMKPGITGFWQVAGNGRVSNFEDVVRLDCDYIDNWSLWLDFRVLAQTAVKVMTGAGW